MRPLAKAIFWCKSGKNNDRWQQQRTVFCHKTAVFSMIRISKGYFVWEQDEIDEVVEKVHNAGFQMTAHAVGDKAVRNDLECY